MSIQTLDLTGLSKRMQQLRTIERLDARDLMLSWEIIIREDNRRGILQGLDGFGVPMIPVKYRPKIKEPLRVGKATKAYKGPANTPIHKTIKGQQRSQLQERNRLAKSQREAAKARTKHEEATKHQFRIGQKRNVKVGIFQGGIGNNLTSSQYRLLGGPPLAPRDQFSRSITNFKAEHTNPLQGGKEWAVIGAWDDVVSTKGVHFFPFHFNGLGRLPRRDLRGIRPTGLAKCVAALRNWARVAIHTHFPLIGPKLTYPQLDLPLGEEVIAYRAIIRVLQNDPTFGAIIRQWRIWDGSVNDTQDESYAQCPFCQISPFPSESDWITEMQHYMPITLRLKLAVAGTNFDQIGNLWAAFRRAIFPKNNASQRALVMSTLTDAGITKPTIQVSAYGQTVDDEGARFMLADGTIKFGLLIST